MDTPAGTTTGTPAARRRTKVAVLIGTLEVGGAEQDIVRNFPRLDRNEFEVVVVLFDYPGALAPELERQGIRVVACTPDPSPAAEEPVWTPGAGGSVEPGRRQREPSLPPAVRAVVRFGPIGWTARRIGSALYIARVTRWVGRTFRRERIDIAHFFLPHSYAYGMFACAFWRPRARTVMSRLSLNFYKDTQRRLAWLERHMLHRHVDIGIGNSRLILEELVQEGVPRERVRLLYNGIDLAPFRRGDDSRSRARDALGIGQDAFVVAAVGNLWSHKGHRDLIEACALVRDQLPAGWQLIVAGRDQEGNLAAYQALIVERDLAENVRLLGPYDDVPQLLSAADVFAQPSLHEGLPNAIIEAMAASLPVIGTAVGGIPEAVLARSAGAAPDEETGWLVPPADPAALSEALLGLASDAARRDEMGRRARARAEALFSLERSVRDYEAIYRELLP